MAYVRYTELLFRIDDNLFISAYDNRKTDPGRQSATDQLLTLFISI